MANTLTNYTPKILQMGLEVLRQNAILPRVVNRNYDGAAAQRGNTVDIPVPNTFGDPVDVASASVPQTDDIEDINPTQKQITLDQWKMKSFTLDDSEYRKIQDGAVPDALASAIKSIANYVDKAIMDKYKKIGNSVGVAGTTPFASNANIINSARALLSKNLADPDQRVAVMDPDASANLMNLAIFHQADQRGDTAGLIEAQMGRKFGLDFFEDQNVTVGAAHTAGTITDDPTVTGAEAVGSTAIGITCDAGDAIALLEGDLVTFGGSRTYTVLADISVGNSATGDISIFPALEVALSGTEALAVKASAVNNLIMHKDCIAMASRPLMDGSMNTPGMQQVTDPVTGLTLRLELTREHKRYRWSFDVLYGVTELRPELGVRVLG